MTREEKCRSEGKRTAEGKGKVVQKRREEKYRRKGKISGEGKGR